MNINQQLKFYWKNSDPDHFFLLKWKKKTLKRIYVALFNPITDTYSWGQINLYPNKWGCLIKPANQFALHICTYNPQVSIDDNVSSTSNEVDLIISNLLADQ